jgi:hypothetical protein
LDKQAKSRFLGVRFLGVPVGESDVLQDRGYGVTSALALVVEAVEAVHLPLRL